MPFIELATELLSKVDFEKSEIIVPQKLVFVCGGKASNVPTAPASLRELLLGRSAAKGKVGYLADAKVLLAEEAMNALAHSTFKNLLDLEEYIASVVQAVILIVESPGSMCELGAFVKTDEIRDKLIVILPGEHKNVPSFITKGAIDFLTQENPDAQILGFHWKNESGIVTAQDYIVDEMLLEIPKAMGQVHKAHARESFNSQKIGHLIYLTLAFCHLLRAAKITDIKNCFAAAGIQISDLTIKRCLDTLIICKLLTGVEHGRLTYHVAQIDRIPIELTFKKDTPDRDRNTMRMIGRLRDAIKLEESFRISMFQDYHHA